MEVKTKKTSSTRSSNIISKKYSAKSTSPINSSNSIISLNNTPSSTNNARQDKYSLEEELKSMLRKYGYNNVTIDEQYDTDTHGFKFKPFKFTNNDNSKSYVVKPRSAILDKYIMELFQKINTVNDLSRGVKLPYYNIASLNDEISIWDFIDGNLIMNLPNIDVMNPASSVNEVVQKGFKVTSTPIQERIDNMAYLNTVCSMIGLTDLHSENVILKNNMYYPIDLESVNPNNVTGLYGFEHVGAVADSLLNTKSQKLIDQFNRKINKLPNRFLPIQTVDFVNFLNDNGVTLEDLVRIMKNDNMSTDLNEKQLKKYLLNCKKHLIIPYFITKNNNIYVYNFKNHKFQILKKDTKGSCRKLSKKKCKNSTKCKYNKTTKICSRR